MKKHFDTKFIREIAYFFEYPRKGENFYFLNNAFHFII